MPFDPSGQTPKPLRLPLVAWLIVIGDALLCVLVYWGVIEGHLPGLTDSSQWGRRGPALFGPIGIIVLLAVVYNAVLIARLVAYIRYGKG
jgi:hypothetical protein